MATVADLSNQGGPLKRMGGNLRSGEQPERLMYASIEAIAWMRNFLADVETDGYFDGSRTPIQQAMDIVHAFVSGEDLSGEIQPHIMQPTSVGIWAIRTHDLRLYGWFWRKNIFIIACIDLKKNVNGNNEAYGQHVKFCCELRDDLNLDDPKTEFGDLEHVTGI